MNDISVLKRKMLVKYPFFGSVIAGVTYKEDEAIDTAATDGKIIYYNPKFLDELDIDRQIFLLSHEVCHIAFDHVLRSEGKDTQLWNIATDAVCNQLLIRDGLKMIEGGVDMPEAINYDAEQLYKELLKKKEQQEQQGQQGQSNNSNGQNQQQSQGQGEGSSSGTKQNQQQNQSQGQGSSDGNEQNQQQSQGQGSSDGQKENEQDKSQDVGHDTHKLWEEAVKKSKEDKSKQSSGENDSKSQKQNDESGSEQNELKNKQEELKKMGEHDAFNKNREEKKKQLEELRKSITAQASQAGSTTNSEIRNVENIGYSRPILDWRYVLKEAVQYDVDWSYKNATIEDGVVTANLEELPTPETEIVLDTSGSIDDSLLRNFLKECKNILHHSKLKVGCFDTKFYGFNDIRNEDDIDNMKFQGGGGTDFDVAVDAFTSRVENKIVFTDGEASMPEKPVDAIWIVFGGCHIKPKGGKVIYISDKDLKRLYSFEMDSNYTRKL